jgi:hypothetical protein
LREISGEPLYDKLLNVPVNIDDDKIELQVDNSGDRHTHMLFIHVPAYYMYDDGTGQVKVYVNITDESIIYHNDSKYRIKNRLDMVGETIVTAYKLLK